MQYWDNVLYPKFLASIRGQYYSIISQDQLDEECYYLACRAISTFKFPRISTDYESFYAVKTNDVLEEVDEDTEDAILHGAFINDLTDAEIEVLVAWMKVYWCENQISNADNFEDIYTDSNIKTFSRANALDKATNLYKTYREYAQELETRYSRVNDSRKPTIGDINSDE